MTRKDFVIDVAVKCFCKMIEKGVTDGCSEESKKSFHSTYVRDSVKLARNLANELESYDEAPWKSRPY